MMSSLNVFMTSSFTLGDVRVENQNLSYSAEILFRGKIRLLITEMSLDWQLKFMFFGWKTAVSYWF